MAYTFTLTDIQGGEQLQIDVETIINNFYTRSEFNNISVLSGLNVGIGTEINELYAVEVQGLTYLRDNLIVGGDTDISGNLRVNLTSNFNGDVSMNSELLVIGNTFLKDNLDVSNNLYVHNKSFLDNDVSMGAHLQVVGDVSMESNLEVDKQLDIHMKSFLDGDVSMGSHLQVVGDVSMESVLEVDGNTFL